MALTIEERDEVLKVPDVTWVSGDKWSTKHKR